MSSQQLSTRIRIIGAFFVLIGLLALIAYAAPLEDNPTSKLAFGLGRTAPVWELPTRLSMLLLGSWFLLSGVVAQIAQLRRIIPILLGVSAALIVPAVLIAAAVGKQTNVLTVVSETLRLATPIALAALAGIWSERAGVVNIGIEGMMLMGAAFGIAAAVAFDNIWIGLLSAVLIGGTIALLHGLLSITFKTDQIVSGTVVNLMALGITSFLRRSYLIGIGGGRDTLPKISLPLLSDIPLIGPVLFNGQPVYYLMFVLVVLTHVVLFSTRWGLRTRAVGENPRAADTVGINVGRTRYLAVFISGCVAGLAGAWFSLETVGQFNDGMTDGKGFIGLAAMIFGKWMPLGAFGGALLFGFAESLNTRFQLLKVPISPEFLQMLPYVVTMIVLAGLVGRAIPPAAVGQPYEK